MQYDVFFVLYVQASLLIRWDAATKQATVGKVQLT